MLAAVSGNVEALLALLPHSDVAARTRKGRDAMDCAAMDARWACMDIMMPLIDSSRAQALFGQHPDGLGAQRFPRWTARQEADALSRAMGASGGEAASGASAEAARPGSGPAASRERVSKRI